MAHLLAVGNLKGGTGKSTIAVNLASAFGEIGRRTVLVDADGQGTASAWHRQGGLPIALETLRQVRAARGPGRPACMLVPSRVDRRTAPGREIRRELERFELAIATGIRQRSVHVRAFDAGRWIGDQAPRSSALAEFRRLRDQVEAKLAAAATSVAA